LISLENFKGFVKEEDHKYSKVIQDGVEKQSLDIFSDLEPNDILFIDSSHVWKEGSDVDFLIFKVLPILERGVIIQFHDIFYPEWKSSKRREWNEGLLIKELLETVDDFKILLFNNFLGKFCSYNVERIIPEFLKSPGGSLWLRKE
jgi:hypothetical protein